MHVRASIVAIAIAVAAAAPAASAQAPALRSAAPAVHHATGTFAVELTPEAQELAPMGGVPTARTALLKRFTGGLMGVARGTMLSVGVPGQGAATYVAIDQFVGSLDGRSGGFVLTQRGTMTKEGVGKLDVVISPDSGTGALLGIAGTLKIAVADGVHTYDLAYTLIGER